MPVPSPTVVPATGAGQPVTAGRFPWRLLWLLLAASLLVQALIYGVITTKPVIRSDGVGYYLYLPAALIHRDLTLETVVRQEFPDATFGRAADSAALSTGSSLRG